MPFSFEAEVAEGLRQAFAASGVSAPAVPLRKIPFADGWGFATQLALMQGRGREGAQALAGQVAERLNAAGRFERAEAVNGYVNVYVDQQTAARSVIDGILDEGEGYGAGAPQGRRILVEFSSPNTHKEFHVGHLRNTAFGDSVARLLSFAGFEVVPSTYIGDIGAHVIRCLWCLQKYHAGDVPPPDRLDWLGRIYAEATRRLEEEPEAKAEIAELFARWEAGDERLLALWRETRRWSIEELQRIYRQLGVHFDVWFFESEVEAEGKAMAEELIDLGIAEYSEGLPVVRLGDKLGVLPILRSDGTSLYQTKELALLVKKFRDHGVDEAVMVTSVSETLYFKQVFAVLERYGFQHAKDLRHISYERVNLPEGRMASRLGNIITYEDLASEAIARVDRIIEEKNPALSLAERQKVAEQVAVSAMKFTMLAFSNTSVITFEWDRVLDFDGFSGPYVQYAYVRAARILEKSRVSGLGSRVSGLGSRDREPGTPRPIERML
ncbi:MAG: arginine--tRNA ligase, partial [Chloroflexota bacterium]|nr:arginine--tRNA ligase [Chloroflexota bacterium]